MELKTILLTLCFSIFVLLAETGLDLQINMLEFSYGVNYKYEGQSSHYIKIFFVAVKFHL